MKKLGGFFNPEVQAVVDTAAKVQVQENERP
jgi:hypothetical protein